METETKPIIPETLKTDTKDYVSTCPSTLPPLSVNGMAEFYADKLAEPMRKISLDPELEKRFSRVVKVRVALTILCSIGAFYAFKGMYTTLQESNYTENSYLLAFIFAALQLGAVLNAAQLGMFAEGKYSEGMSLTAARSLALGDLLFGEVYRLWNALSEKEHKIGNLTTLLEAERQKNAELREKLNAQKQESDHV